MRARRRRCRFPRCGGGAFGDAATNLTPRGKTATGTPAKAPERPLEAPRRRGTKKRVVGCLPNPKTRHNAFWGLWRGLGAGGAPKGESVSGSRRYRIAVFCGVVLLGWLVPGLPAEPLPPEAEAIRVERERQRAALDRVRRKVEALREAEARGESPVPVVSPPGTPDLEREWARHEAREREAAAERERQEAEARRLKEERFWREWRQRLGVGLLALFGAFCLLPFFPLYRDFIDHAWKHTAWSSPKRLALVFSAASFAGAAWLWEEGRLPEPSERFLILGFFGLWFWFYLPGLFGLVLIFLHSLFVPHPMEVTLERMRRGEKIGSEEAARVVEALRDFQERGIPTDWRVRSRIWRLERLTRLLGKEKVFLDLLNEYILNQHQRGRRS